MEQVSVRLAANNFDELEQQMQAAVSRGGLTTIEIGGSFDFPRTIELNSTTNNVNIVFQPAAGTVLGVAGDYRHFDIAATGSFILELKGTVLDGGQQGGGIRFSGAQLYLFSGTVSNCRAPNGGGLFVNGKAVVEAMHFLSNTCQPQPGTPSSNTGGGIYVENGELLLFAETIIEYNGGPEVTSGGGVFAADGCTVDIRTAIIQFNEAERGGGVSLGDQGTLKQGGYIQSNRAFFGGGGVDGAYTTESTSGAITQTSYLFINGHVKDNVCERTAGGIYGGEVTVGRGGFVSRNRVTGPGSEAGILCARFVMEDGLVSDNILESPALYYTPGVGIKCTSALITGGTIRGNAYENDTGRATFGGGIYCEPRQEGDTLIINGGTITGNKAHNGGGVIMSPTSSARYTTPPVLQINAGEITGNEAVSGGGVYTSGFDLEITGGTIADNRYQSYGGGIYSTGRRLIINDAEITGNTPANRENVSYGGGVYLNFFQENSDCLVTIGGATRITDNEGANGGGLYLGVQRALEAGVLSVAGNTVIEDNIADNNGGGLFLSNFRAILTGPLQIHHNSAVNGGGIVASRTILDLAGDGGNLLLTENLANDGGGIYAFNEGTSVRLVANVTLSENNAGENGGAIWVDDLEKLSVLAPSVIFTGNLATDGYRMTDPADIALHESLIQTDTFTQPFQYAYNNYDVNYQKGDLLTDNLTVTFDSLGGSYIPSQSVAPGGLLEEPEAPNRPGFLFNGWYRDPDLQIPWNFTQNPVTENLTLYAGWIALPLDLFTVTYQANGGTGAFTQAGIPDNSSYTIQSLTDTGIQREGYFFTGWNTAADGTGTDYTPRRTITITSDLVLYAQWAALPPAPGPEPGPDPEPGPEPPPVPAPPPPCFPWCCDCCSWYFSCCGRCHYFSF